MNLATPEKITWCPGCPNSAILVAFRKAVEEFVSEGTFKLHDIVAGAGVGCHGKIADYLNVNTFNSLHGRVIPTMTGVKLGNPKLNVVAFTGDGDSFSEGLSHVVHAAQKNTDISMFLHNNELFALTTGQATALSPAGLKGGSTPFGNPVAPLSPMLLMLASGATFVARTYAGEIEKTKQVMKAAMLHKGFSFVEIIQPCITFFDTRDFFKERIYWIPEDHDKSDLNAAFERVRIAEEKVSLGIFYDVAKPTYEESI